LASSNAVRAFRNQRRAQTNSVARIAKPQRNDHDRRSWKHHQRQADQENRSTDGRHDHPADEGWHVVQVQGFDASINPVLRTSHGIEAALGWRQDG